MSDILKRIKEKEEAKKTKPVSIKVDADASFASDIELIKKHANGSLGTSSTTIFTHIISESCRKSVSDIANDIRANLNKKSSTQEIKDDAKPHE